MNINETWARFEAGLKEQGIEAHKIQQIKNVFLLGASAGALVIAQGHCGPLKVIRDCAESLGYNPATDPTINPSGGTIH